MKIIKYKIINKTSVKHSCHFACNINKLIKLQNDLYERISFLNEENNKFHWKISIFIE